jgi:hypothetical protein
MQLERVVGVDLRSARSLDDEDEVFAGVLVEVLMKVIV